MCLIESTEYELEHGATLRDNGATTMIQFFPYAGNEGKR